MEATGSNGQFYAYNTYATPPATNPLFLGFSRYQNINKEIIIKNSQTLVNSVFARVFLCLKIVFVVNLV